MHSLFALGPLLVIAALAGLALRAVLARRDPLLAPVVDGDAARARSLAWAGLAMTLASAVNPRGFEQHLTFFSSSRDTAIWAIGDEWRHFDPFSWPTVGAPLSPLAWMLTDLAIVLALGLGIARLTRFLRAPDADSLRRLDAVHLALAAAGSVAVLASIRFVWMGIFPLLYLIRALPRSSSAGWAVAAAATAVAVAFPTAGLFLERARTAPRTLEVYLRQPYSISAFYPRGFHFLRDTGVEGRLFNRYTLGGFLGYWLSPGLRTFVDGRTEHYRADVLADYFRIARQLEARPGESALAALDRRGVDLFFGVGMPVEGEPFYTTPALEAAPGWLPVSRSVDHAIYLRTDTSSRDNLERIARFYAQAGVPFDTERGFEPLEAARQNPAWAIEHGVVPRDYPQLRTDAQGDNGPRAERARERLALLYYLLGAYEEQISIDRRLVLARPTAPTPTSRLVLALLRLERDSEAAAYLADFARRAEPNPRVERLEQLGQQVARLRNDPAARARPSSVIDSVLFLPRAELRRFFQTAPIAKGERPEHRAAAALELD